MLAASIFRTMNALMMGAASASETSENFTRLHGAAAHKAAIFTDAAVRISNSANFISETDTKLIQIYSVLRSEIFGRTYITI